MSLRIACTTDAEITGFPDLTDELNRMVILIRKWEICIGRDISAECENIFNSTLFEFADYGMYLLPGV